MELHILNGDALMAQIKGSGISGKFIVFRECLIEGPVVPDTTSLVFWQQRAAYLEKTYGEPPLQYRATVVNPMEQLAGINKNMPVNLWFENDLFCQANLWFILKFMRQKNLANKVYRVFPQPPEQPEDWKGFGKSSPAGLAILFKNKVAFTETGASAGANLWNAFVQKDFRQMQAVAEKAPPGFAHLPEVADAFRCLHPKTATGLSRPERRLRKILASGKTEFGDIFRAFNETEGIYGFGDASVKAMLEKAIKTG